MRYMMQQKWFSLADSFNIRDETGRDVYQVQGKFLTIGAQLSFRDMMGNELAQIKQRLLSLSPTYELYHGGQLRAVVHKELFTLFNCRFTVNVPGPDDLEAQGDFLDHFYTFTRAGVPVAQVSKEWFALVDTYGVDVVPGEDDLLILASTVVIDMACHGDHDRGIFGLLGF